MTTEPWKSEEDARIAALKVSLESVGDEYNAMRIERDALKEELAHANARLKQARDVLMEAQPMVKARLIDFEDEGMGSPDESILGRIDGALKP